MRMGSNPMICVLIREHRHTQREDYHVTMAAEIGLRLPQVTTKECLQPPGKLEEVMEYSPLESSQIAVLSHALCSILLQQSWRKKYDH